jgi:hypothetical protein
MADLAAPQIPTSPAAPAGPMPAEGAKARARFQVVMARKLLEQAVPVLGSEGEEGKAVLTCLKSLAGIYKGSGSEGLLDTEAARLRETATPTPTAAPTGLRFGGPRPLIAAGR